MSENIRTAVHRVEYSAGKERKVAEPGDVFNVPEKDLEFFEGVGAVRKPTEGELAIAERLAASAAKKAVKGDKPANVEKPATNQAAGAGEGNGQGGEGGEGASGDAAQNALS